MWSDGGVGSEENTSFDGNDENSSTEMTTTENAEESVEPQTLARRRSMSVPCRNEATADIGAVVAKAKKASTYLWMLLHSQSCRLGVNRCTHTGCQEAKLVHLHLKTCPAGQDFPCPTRHPGCLQARKLLAHYRRCRTMRARQAGQPAGLKSQRPCLICSMVARQARTLLDAGAKAQPGPVHKKSSYNSKQPALTSFTLSASGMNPVQEVPTEAPKMPASFTASRGLGPIKPMMGGSAQWKMPPPPPRLPKSPRSAPVSPTTPVAPGTTCKDAAMKIGSSSFSHLSICDPEDEAQRRLHRRQRSGSLDVRSSSKPRVVTFCPSQLEDSREQDPMVSVELENAEADMGFSEISSPTRRARSASCHVLSASKPLSEGPADEELGTATSG